MSAIYIYCSCMIALLLTSCGVSELTEDDVPRYQTNASQPFQMNELVILGQVIECHTTRLDKTEEDYTYRIRVICDRHSRIKPGIEMMLYGPRQWLRTGSIQIPDMAIGAYFVMPVNLTSDEKRLEYTLKTGSRFWLPIGLEIPAPVAEKDVSDLKIAMLGYGDLPLGDLQLPLQDKEIATLRTSDNYFLWAMGTATMARQASSSADLAALADELQEGAPENYNDTAVLDNPAVHHVHRPIITPRQAIWLVHCLEDVAPEKARMSPEAVQSCLRMYMERWLLPKESKSFSP